MAPKYRILHFPSGFRYAVSAVSFLCGKQGDGYCLLDEIAESLRLPRAFLGKMLQRLAARGLLDSRRGAHGGYRLSRPASELTLADVLAAVSEPIPDNPHCRVESRDCDPGLPCLLHDSMLRAEARLWKQFQRERLSQFQKRIKERVLMREKTARRGGAAALLLLAVLTLRAPGLRAADPQDFAQNCANCHTIGGGRLTGPDLKDVSKRRTRDWLKRFIADPKAMLDAGDPAVVELYKGYNNVLMPTVSGLTAERIDGLLQLIDEESALPKSRFAGSQLINRPLLPSDVAEGRELFAGRKPLKNGGPACISCHSVGGMEGLGGGFLGPDLTGAFSRVGGEKALAAWLVSPGSPVMRPVYAQRAMDPADILPLVAYLKDAAQQGRPADSIARLAFLIIGLVGAAALFVALDALFGGRLRSVRRALVEKKKGLSEAHDG